MKKTILLLLLSAYAGISFSQESFGEDNRNLDIKLDFAGYSGTITDNFTDSVQNSTAGGIVLTTQMQWAVARSISLGGSVAFNYYLNSFESSEGNPRLTGLDANFIFDAHFLRSPKTDMMAGLKLGIAGIRLNSDDGTGDVYGSMGGTADIHFMARFYVSNRMAIIANIALPGYSFNKFGKNLFDTYTIKWNGLCFGTGIAFKLLNQRTSGSQRNK